MPMDQMSLYVRMRHSFPKSCYLQTIPKASLWDLLLVLGTWCMPPLESLQQTKLRLLSVSPSKLHFFLCHSLCFSLSTWCFVLRNMLRCHFFFLKIASFPKVLACSWLNGKPGWLSILQASVVARLWLTVVMHDFTDIMLNLCECKKRSYPG